MESNYTVIRSSEIEEAIESHGVNAIQMIADNRKELEQRMECVRLREDIDSAFDSITI